MLYTTHCYILWTAFLCTIFIYHYNHHLPWKNRSRIVKQLLHNYLIQTSSLLLKLYFIFKTFYEFMFINILHFTFCLTLFIYRSVGCTTIVKIIIVLHSAIYELLYTIIKCLLIKHCINIKSYHHHNKIACFNFHYSPCLSHFHHKFYNIKYKKFYKNLTNYFVSVWAVNKLLYKIYFINYVHFCKFPKLMYRS